MPSPIDPSNPPPHHVYLDVSGTVPPGLSGRVVGIDRDGVVRSVYVHGGRASYLDRSVRTDAMLHNLVAFGSSVLAFGDDSPAYELSADMDALRRVDLAGHGRALGAYPKLDPTTGQLHLIARDTAGMQAHVVVSAGALTRHSRPILDTPNRITDLTLTGDRVVFVADGFVGVAPRDGEPRTTWIATGVAAPHPVQAHDAGDAVVLLALTPSFERWILHPATGAIQPEVLDSTPRRFAHSNGRGINGAPRFVWATGTETIDRHDLVASQSVRHSMWPRVPGDFVVVTDSARPDDADGGWLVGFVGDASAAATDLRVIDAADIAGPAVATVRLPRPTPSGLRCTWIPTTPAMTTPAITSTKEYRP